MSPTKIISVYTKILGQDIVSDTDWYRYLYKYPNKEMTLYNARYPVVRQLGPTLYRLTCNLLNH
jgi:hypothetical protein